MERTTNSNNREDKLFNQKTMQEDINLVTAESAAMDVAEKLKESMPHGVLKDEEGNVTQFSGNLKDLSEGQKKRLAKAVAYTPSDDELIIHRTTDYAKFKYLESNRPINWKHVENLKNNMLKFNLSPDLPIIVNEEMEILDGQHRFHANRQLELPVYYKISRVFDEEYVALINSTSEAWKTEDYLHYYISHGNKHYINLERFVDYTGVQLNVAIGLLTGGTTAPAAKTMKEFQMGLFEISHPSHAINVLGMIDSFKEYFKSADHKTFMNAVSRISTFGGYSHEHMMHKLSTRSSKLHKQPDVKGYVENLSEIYNTNIRKAQGLLFHQAEEIPPKADEDPENVLRRKLPGFFTGIKGVKNENHKMSNDFSPEEEEEIVE